MEEQQRQQADGASGEVSNGSSGGGVGGGGGTSSGSAAGNVGGGNLSKMDQLTLDLLRKYRCMAKVKSRRAQLLKQEENAVSVLVYLLDESKLDSAVVFSVLEILLFLTEDPSDCRVVKESLGMEQVLSNLVHSPACKMEKVSLMIAKLEERFRLLDAQNVHDILKEKEQTILREIQSNVNSMQLNTTPPPKKRHTNASPVHFKQPHNNQMPSRRFISGAMAKTTIFQLDRTTDKDRAAIERVLLNICGVISIYFDFYKNRCVVRAKRDVLPEAIGSAVLHTHLTSVRLVTRNLDGTEDLRELTIENEENQADVGDRTTPGLAAVANENLPDYLPDDYGIDPQSPESAAHCVVHSSDKRAGGKQSGGWFGRVGQLITDALW